MENQNPIKMDDLGISLFLETPIYIYNCIYFFLAQMAMTPTGLQVAGHPPFWRFTGNFSEFFFPHLKLIAMVRFGAPKHGTVAKYLGCMGIIFDYEIYKDRIKNTIQHFINMQLRIF